MLGARGRDRVFGEFHASGVTTKMTPQSTQQLCHTCYSSTRYGSICGQGPSCCSRSHLTSTVLSSGFCVCYSLSVVPLATGHIFILFAVPICVLGRILSTLSMSMKNRKSIRPIDSPMKHSKSRFTAVHFGGIVTLSSFHPTHAPPPMHLLCAMPRPASVLRLQTHTPWQRRALRPPHTPAAFSSRPWPFQAAGSTGGT